jgi:drug/metabolite transporter (DMT)-like permease
MRGSQYAVYTGNLVTSLWIFCYFITNIGLTLHSKWLFEHVNFHYPWMLTCIHLFVSGFGAFILSSTSLSLKNIFSTANRPKGSFTSYLPLQVDSDVIKVPDLKGHPNPWTKWISLLFFSLLYTTNIALSNISLDYVSLSFHQLFRSLSPLFTVILELLILNKKTKAIVYLTLVPIMLGVYLATKPSLSNQHYFASDMFGYILTISGVLLSVLKGIMTKAMLVGSIGWSPLELIYKVSPICIMQCLVCSWIFGEFGSLLSNSTIHSYNIMLSLLCNGTLAFCLNWVSFTCVKKTSALTMTIIGNMKQIASILIAIWIYNINIESSNIFGIVLTLIGGVLYSISSFKN